MRSTVHVRRRAQPVIIIEASGVVGSVSIRFAHSIAPCDDRPGVGIDHRFSAEVAGIVPLRRRRYGSRSNAACGYHPVSDVDLDDTKCLGVERLGPLILASNRRKRQRAGDLHRSPISSTLGPVRPSRPPACTPPTTASRPCRTPAFATRRRSSSTTSITIIVPNAAQSRAAKYAWTRSDRPRCRVRQPGTHRVR